MAYPVVMEVSLDPVEREGLKRRRRVLAELPPVRLGEVYVFKTDGQFVSYGERHVRFTDRLVVDAIQVSLVQTRPQNVRVEALAGEYTVLATFRCRVQDPAAVAQASLTDVEALLASYLHEAIEPHTDRREVEAHVRAFCVVAPPEVPGVDVVLATVRVLAPSELLAEQLYEDFAPNGGQR
jgi:hypothetical protein